MKVSDGMEEGDEGTKSMIATRFPVFFFVCGLLVQSSFDLGPPGR
jgi:hypothetical protein